MQNESDFESAFERALAAYADPAGAGDARLLTARVLAAVEKHRSRRIWLFSFGVAVPALTCLLIAMIFLLPNTRQVQKITYTPLAPTLPIFSAAPSQSAAVSREKRASFPAVHKQRHELPKLNQFPAATGLTEQERLLVNFATHTSPQVQLQVVQAQQQAIQPLHFANLSISPLNPAIHSQTQE
jgi:hypothetical protein